MFSLYAQSQNWKIKYGCNEPDETQQSVLKPPAPDAPGYRRYTNPFRFPSIFVF